MKKRIISLILVVVMLALALVGCGEYSYADDDLSKYAKFAESKQAFADALKSLEIKDGDFTDDPETRVNKVIDAMYAALASASTSTEKKTGGVIGAHDILYYNYYITFVNDEGKTVFIAPEYMKTTKAVKLQTGKMEMTDLEKAINEAISGFDFTDKAYKQETTGSIAKDQVVYISYKFSYDLNEDETVTGSVTLKRAVVDENDPIFKALLSGKKVEEEGKDPTYTAIDVGTKYSEKIEFTVEGGYELNGKKVTQEITVTDAKVEFVEKGDAILTYEDDTHVEATEKVAYKDIYGNEVDVKGKKITYHVYPSSYTVVDELNATNIITLIYGKNFTEAVAQKLVFGVDFADKTAEEKETILKTFTLKTKDGDKDVEKDFATAVADLAKLLSDYASKKTTLTTAETNLTKAQTALEEADEAGKAAAEKNVKDCEDAKKKAEEALETAKKDRDALVKAFVEVVVSGKTVEEIIVKGYEDVTYSDKQTAYRTDIKNKLAAKILELIEKNVTVTGYPTEAVDGVYDQLFNDYQYSFYNENAKDSNDKEIVDENGNKVTNYTQYGGSFRTFLCEKMGVDNYKAAREELRKDAQEMVKTVLQFSFVAAQFDQVYTDAEFEEYRDNDSMEELLELYYGLTGDQIDEYYNNARNALQFDKLINHFLESEEKKDDTDERFVNDEYKNVKFTKTKS